jgi:hypothetical protein
MLVSHCILPGLNLSTHDRKSCPSKSGDENEKQKINVCEKISILTRLLCLATFYQVAFSCPLIPLGSLPLSANSIYPFKEISSSQKLVEPVEPNRVFNETIHTRIQQSG